MKILRITDKQMADRFDKLVTRHPTRMFTLIAVCVHGNKWFFMIRID
ncbi:MAG: hypothetical protein ACXABY_04855 [Candidatus Thorarchaeota archaeon]|jgi:hypothetical protein